MAYLVVENFSAGLDTRRHPLTARPGTLQKLKNAHVSRGGEIEKRKAFEVINTYEPTIFPSSFHGLQATTDKIYTFTDGINHSGSYTEYPVGSNGLYAKVLIHPSYSLGLSNGTHPRLAGVVYSTLYGGKTFVLAKFDNGDVIPYLDGEFLSDFYLGTTRQWMTSLSNPWDTFCSTLSWQIRGGNWGLTTTGWDSDSSNVPNGQPSWVDLIAPVDVDFTPSFTTGVNVTMSTSVIDEFKAGTPATKASGSFAISSGSSGTPASFQRALRYIGATPKIMNIYFDEQEAIDEPGGWTGFDWNSQAVGSTTAVGLAYNIDYYLANFSRNRDGLADTPVGDALYTYQGVRRGTPIGYIKLMIPNTTGSYYDDHAANNGKDIEIEFASDPSLVPNIGELIDVSTIAPSGFNTGRWTAKFATMGGGVTNAVTQVLVDGVDIMGSPVKWGGSHSETMAKIVDRINSFTSSPEYVASISSDKVKLTAATTGTSQNGHVIEVKTLGNVSTSNYSSFTGGSEAIAGVRKRVRFFIGNGSTFYPDESVTLIATKTLDPANPVYFGASRVTNTKPTAALTFKTKSHLTSGSSLFFSAVNNARKWGQDGVGSGFINMSNSSGGNEVLSAVAVYQGNLATFSRRTVQIWSIDTDPANNKQGQVLSNTGAFGQKSVVSVGDIDVFYLSDSGVRSIRARDSSNAAVINDVGTPIDNLILEDISGLTFEQKAACPAVIEPIDGRYWIAVGDKIYVYSYFPSSQIAAWSTYEAGRSFTDFTTKDGKIYAKEGNYVYVYGGLDGQTYDSSEVEVIMPYLDGGKPAHTKTLMGIDMTCEGEWAVEIGMDPINPGARDHISSVSQPTFTLGRIQATGIGTHVGVRMVNESPGYARLANLICHFEFNESE